MFSGVTTAMVVSRAAMGNEGGLGKKRKKRQHEGSVPAARKRPETTSIPVWDNRSIRCNVPVRRMINCRGLPSPFLSQRTPALAVDQTPATPEPPPESHSDAPPNSRTDGPGDDTRQPPRTAWRILRGVGPG